MCSPVVVVAIVGIVALAALGCRLRLKAFLTELQLETDDKQRPVAAEAKKRKPRSRQQQRGKKR
jgi:hypothetical protein